MSVFPDSCSDPPSTAGCHQPTNQPIQKLSGKAGLTWRTGGPEEDRAEDHRMFIDTSFRASLRFSGPPCEFLSFQTAAQIRPAPRDATNQPIQKPSGRVGSTWRSFLLAACGSAALIVVGHLNRGSRSSGRPQNLRRISHYQTKIPRRLARDPVLTCERREELTSPAAARRRGRRS